MPFAFWADYFRKLDVVAFLYIVIAGATWPPPPITTTCTSRGELRAAPAGVRSWQRLSSKSLKSQLHPHFLFNTLNAINALIHEDPQAADRVLTRLAELLRMTLNAGGAQQVALAQEIELIPRLSGDPASPPRRAFARLVRGAGGSSSRTRPGTDAQPTVENAVIHGLSRLPRGGTVHIAACRDNGTVTLRVEDDGAGVPTTTRIGIGLSNVSSRLQYLYGESNSQPDAALGRRHHRGSELPVRAVLTEPSAPAMVGAKMEA